MKKLLTAIVITLTGLTALCQQRVFEVPLDTNELSSLQAFPVYDAASGQLLLTFTTRHTLRRYSLRAADTSISGPAIPLDTFVTDRKGRKTSLLPLFEHYWGSTPIDGGVEDAFLSDGMIRFIRTLYHGGAPQQTDSIVFTREEWLFGGFYQQGAFYCLTSTKGGDEIRIRRHRPGGGITSTTKTVAVKDWGKVSQHLPARKMHIGELSDLAADVTQVSTDPATFPPLLATLSRVKLYAAPGRVYITFDNTQLETHVIDLPLDDRPARVMQFNAESWYHAKIPSGFSNGNSFIFDSTMIVAAIIHLQPWLAFYDLSTQKLIGTYAPDQKGDPSFAHSPAWQVGDLWKKDKMHRIPFPEFGKQSFDYWTLGVTAGHFGNDHLVLQIGTLYDRETFGKMMLMLGSMAVSAAALSPSILYARPGWGPANTLFFKAHFSTSTLQPLPYPAFDDKSGLINNFAVAKTLTDNGGFLLERDGTYWWGFIDTVFQQFVIYKF